MLILTRKISESIVIDDNVCVTIINIKGNQVRLGITIAVNREEIHLAKKAMLPATKLTNTI